MVIVWHFVALYKKIFEFIWIARNAYSNRGFRRADALLRKAYFWKSPYRVARSYGRLYGHTPLYTFEKILKVCHIRKGDKLVELGCGEGRVALYAAAFHQIETLGIDLISSFIETAIEIQKNAHIKKLSFIEEDFVELDYSDVNAVYFFATGLDESTLAKVGKQLLTLPQGAKVITVSVPMEDFQKKGFYLWKSFSGSFYFGVADIYCYVRDRKEGESL